MKSILAINVIIFSCLLSLSYLLYEYREYGSSFIHHLIDSERPIDSIFHILILITPIGAAITGYLINERKKLLISTKESKVKLAHAAREWRATFDSMPYGVLLTDSKFNILRANQYVSFTTGMSYQQLISGRKCFDIICHIHNGPKLCPLQKSMQTNKTTSYEYSDSSNCFFGESITPMVNSTGEVQSFIHVITDISDTKNKEAKLIESKDAFFNMLKDLDYTYKELKDVHDNLVVTFSNIIDAKSSWTKGHSTNVATYSIAIAREMELNHVEVETLKTASLLHDIGKIGTYDVILDKPDELNDIEFALIRQHTIKGEEILKPIRGLEKVLPIIRGHHEQCDGSGYPDGLKRDEIPMLARILCVADSFDAITANRPYRLSLGKDYAISEIKRCSSSQFDPDVVHAFLSILEKDSQTVFRA